MRDSSSVVAGPAPAPLSSADDVLAEMNRIPLFMTHLDPEDTENNAELDALRSLAYEGTRAEVAGNFRTQGNECAVAKQWSNAREFYTRALAVLDGKELSTDGQVAEIELGAPPTNASPHEETEGDERVIVDLDEEEAKERAHREACLVNRALCNLELKNYGSCNRDCATALKINPRNVKAFYRVAAACLALDRVVDAADACKRALLLDQTNSAAKTLLEKIEARKKSLEKQATERIERQRRKAREMETLKKALEARSIKIRMTKEAPVDIEDAKLQLEDPLNADSTLQVPSLLLYPTHAQSDIIKAFREDETLADHLEYILPLPWDLESEFVFDSVECYMDTAAGGLAKVGKKIALKNLLKGGKFELTDGMCKIFVVPKAKTSHWIEEVKRKKGL